MKKTIIILIISLFTCAALFAQEQAYEYKPLVEPGKTWWYEASRTPTGEHRIERVAIGIRISGSENINGTEWGCCRFVNLNNRAETLSPIIAYIRQEGTRVYVYNNYPSIDEEPYDKILNDQLISWPWWCTDEFYEFLLMDMSKNVEAGINILHYLDLTVIDTSYFTFFGTERKIQSCSDNVLSYYFIDGIGHINNEGDWGGFFFLPTTSIRCCGYWGVELQGVVDADENLLWAADESIVHPWELAGADDAVTDRTTWSYADGEIRCAADATIRVLDTTGRETLAPVRVAAGGTLKPALDSGIYILEVTTDAGRDVRKIAR